VCSLWVADHGEALPWDVEWLGEHGAAPTADVKFTIAYADGQGYCIEGTAALTGTHPA